MNKYKILLLLFCTMTFMLSGCKPKLKTVNGTVSQVVVNGDTLKNMELKTEDGNMTFDLREVRLNEGIMMQGDSVIVNYIVRHDTTFALVVTVLPKKPHYVDLKKDTANELLTVPVDSVKK